jgi:hypothetical protein
MRLCTYLSPEEYNKVLKEYKATTCMNFSEFIRTRLNRQPETVFYRNQSADDFLLVALGLKDQLTTTITQFSCASEKLNSIRNIPELSTSVYELEAKMFSLEQRIDEIKLRMNQIYDHLWSQK